MEDEIGEANDKTDSVSKDEALEEDLVPHSISVKPMA